MIRKIHLIAAIVAVVVLTGCGEDTSQNPGRTGPGDVGVDTIPPAPIIGLLAKSPTPKSLALVWTAPGDDGNVGTAAEYEIRYSTDSLAVVDWVGATGLEGEPAPNPAGSPEMFRIGGLNSLTSYYFGIKTRDEAGNTSALSTIGRGTTLQESQPPAPVTNLRAESFATGTVKLTWTAPGDDGMQGRAAEYDIRYRTDGPITSANWSQSAKLVSPPVPKMAGEPELLALEGSSYSNCFFAMKAADEVPNWSDVSNVAFSLDAASLLYIYPHEVHAGESIVVYFRAPSHTTVSIHVHYMYTPETLCLSARSHPWVVADIVDAEQLYAGVHVTEFDFRTAAGDLLPNGAYVINICWGSNHRQLTWVHFYND